MLSTNHKWVESIFSHTAAVLTTQVNEIGTICVRPVLVICPVSLLVSTFTLEIEMIYQVVKSSFCKVVNINYREVLQRFIVPDPLSCYCRFNL